MQFVSQNEGHGFYSSEFAQSEADGEDPSGYYRQIACKRCRMFHHWELTRKSKSRARWCQVLFIYLFGYIRCVSYSLDVQEIVFIYRKLIVSVFMFSFSNFLFKGVQRFSSGKRWRWMGRTILPTLLSWIIAEGNYNYTTSRSFSFNSSLFMCCLYILCMLTYQRGKMTK